MTAKSEAVRRIPEGYTTVTPFVIVKGAAQLIDYMKEAFGGQELAPPMIGEDGSIWHAEVRVGDAVVMMFDSKAHWPRTPAFLRLYVDDCDATYQQALKAGGTSVTRPTKTPWGDRVCRVRDPLGNLWWIMAHLEDVSLEEQGRRFGQQEYIDAMQYIQSAEFFPAGKPTPSTEE